jgi:malate/lactate dehydrogenase
VTSDAARAILVSGARALAHEDRLERSLDVLLGVIAGELDIDSAVIVVAGRSEGLEIVASVGLGEAAAEGLAAAIQNPGHPIARTAVDALSAFDVLPTQPGGPALRSHVPLCVTRNGSTKVLGVLALAHEHELGEESRSLIAAAADLAAVAIERHDPA